MDRLKHIASETPSTSNQRNSATTTGGQHPTFTKKQFENAIQRVLGQAAPAQEKPTELVVYETAAESAFKKILTPSAPTEQVHEVDWCGVQKPNKEFHLVRVGSTDFGKLRAKAGSEDYRSGHGLVHYGHGLVHDGHSLVHYGHDLDTSGVLRVGDSENRTEEEDWEEKEGKVGLGYKKYLAKNKLRPAVGSEIPSGVPMSAHVPERGVMTPYCFQN
ncbi:hypothetical protein B0T26DRAFT_788982 [Lasiosphaeria miniovina]|uniref:Uncharacterized protein n=1 Tax=Lasiosphaeria miniovina TaxID=1954250 RepID=A0AA39ZYY0_9PEZI|nr:uncharacterized protein B0T26DRAFT_788982 [Lasiosphaeria miniovina]KAK0706231.1 hypothetical protein B0T26DRAFT_788982 [Lasiosphaeria miniovina]